MSGKRTPDRVRIRPAVAGDKEMIRGIIRQAKISPLDLDWRRFQVAAVADKVIGTGQIRVYGDGTRELASLAVVPEWQHLGLATRLVQELLAPETGDVFLICQDRLRGFYQRFGFSTARPENYPRRLGRYLRLGNIFFSLTEKIGGDSVRLIIMRREAESDNG